MAWIFIVDIMQTYSEKPQLYYLECGFFTKSFLIITRDLIELKLKIIGI